MRFSNTHLIHKATCNLFLIPYFLIFEADLKKNSIFLKSAKFRKARVNFSNLRKNKMLLKCTVI